MARWQTHRHHVFGLENKSLVRNDPELYWSPKANSRALGISLGHGEHLPSGRLVFDQFVRSDDLTPRRFYILGDMFAIRLCWFKALVPFNTAARFRFSRSPGSTNATIFGKTTGLLGRNRNFAEWSKSMCPFGQMPFSLFFHCIYGNYLIFHIVFKRGF